MSGSLNKVMLIGNLGKDPEIKTFEGGNSLARFPLATSETYTNRQTNERVTQTEWHTVVLRRGLAEVAEKYLHKGDKIFIEGKIKTRSWENDRGEKQYATEVHADNMTMLGGRRDDDSSQGSGNMRGPSEPVDISRNDEDDDLPF
ncbi:MAG TPA: single-stranded DNA-binding protein [Cryomorphaceae bacterium]|nr:single-stranded DNA-binding protein [Owenweeksia sp.]MBF97459.1 single-stranded DNA-binding protein [Owenweeksia sp.]HAD96021.1 single-stranded DNA-binding protein [Cryomorphaceae bacterium]HBF20408.1 single-stranded DNA-binding protein [Cryomorphaceae bacterium]HCQ16372.1 single-stranded DNA-binding protein [Cryomorphaceae bacterium]|tara:strand:- start:755 stop:1189 length:435 start_codon:yes stop_codon:yes gene_type:complete